MKKPLTIYTIVPWGSGASQYYRIMVPLLTARDLGLPVQVVVDRQEATTSAEDRVRSFCEADVVLLYHPVGEGPIHNIRGVQGFVPSRRDGEWKWPPSVVIESDDNLFHVSPLNQAFKSLGIRDSDGNEIPLGHHVGMMQDGEPRILFRDGENGFSFARNRQVVASWRTILNLADVVQCSTQPLADEIRGEPGVWPARLKVFPNLVRLGDYEQLELREDPRQVKIFWQGGQAHYDDWYPLRQALGNITRRYPQVHWVVWGQLFSWIKELIPAHRMTYKDWCHYSEYKLRLAMIGHDISLAPLCDNRFNRCRSAIKFYESSVLKKPAATLAQRAAAYRDEVVEGETGLLFDGAEEFEEKLSRLIEDQTERQRLAANAKDWVSENRDAMKYVPRMIRFWEELREERRREQPRMSDAEWSRIEAEDRAEQEREAEAAVAVP